ncbi:MAG: ribosome maturation factor [Ginsengibacter sp.]
MRRNNETERREPGVPFFFYTALMSREDQIEIVQKLLHPLLTDDIFLVDIKIKPINNIKIYLDADSGLGIEKCIKINRALYRIMEEMSIYPEGDFSLEVSSPGIDEPLKLHRQYIKNIARDIEIALNDGTTQQGKLIDVNENEISIEFTEGKNKKAIVKQLAIPFSEIKEAVVLIKF